MGRQSTLSDNGHNGARLGPRLAPVVLRWKRDVQNKTVRRYEGYHTCPEWRETGDIAPVDLEDALSR